MISHNSIYGHILSTLFDEGALFFTIPCFKAGMVHCDKYNISGIMDI